MKFYILVLEFRFSHTDANVFARKNNKSLIKTHSRSGFGCLLCPGLNLHLSFFRKVPNFAKC